MTMEAKSEDMSDGTGEKQYFSDIVPIRWAGDRVEMLDQTLLPSEEKWVQAVSSAEVVHAISCLLVRGAPLIGVTAAYGMALAGLEYACPDEAPASALSSHVHQAGEELVKARPTAVNLAWAVERQLGLLERAVVQGKTAREVRRLLVEGAGMLHSREQAACRSLGAIGADFLPEQGNVLTHCNAGALATGGYGTALGVVRAGREAGKNLHVWVDETRPVWQGARLTAWELTRAGIPNTLIVDGAAAYLMAQGKVDVCVVGADRIAMNGDVANKIGTYGVALAAAAHGLSFLVAAPVSTLDPACGNGGEIEIEERSSAEVTSPFGASHAVALPEQTVLNLAFDVTPAALVTAIVTEVGVARPPYGRSLPLLLR